MTTDALRLAQPSMITTIRNYIALTKPMIIVLLLITTVPAMVVAEGGWPSNWLVLATLVGGTLSAGGANTINCWYDRDIDGVMKRTRSRPLVTGAIQPSHALAFGIGLGVFAFAFLWLTTTFAAACLATAALLFYVFIYTVWLKRRTPQNIVIGGAAGAFPPIVGFAAATGNLSLPALWLFLVVFIWTPPHFWALAILIKDKYAAANVPMLPVVRGDRHTARQVLWYSIALVAFTVVPYLWGPLGVVYLGSALSLGGVFLGLAVQLLRAPTHKRAGALFHYSLLYLALLFVAMSVDVVVL